MKHTLTGSQEKTLMKLIIHPETNKVFTPLVLGEECRVDFF